MSSKPARKPKSHKADGTPKKRWTAAERAARGHAPRRSGGRPRSERRTEDRYDRENRPRRFDRDDRPRYERDDRPRRFDREERPRRFDRDDRPRYEREDRPRRFDRDDRPRRNERDDRARYDRDDRPRRYDRDDRPRYERDGRPRRFDRDDRRGGRDRDDRRPAWGRDDRPKQRRWDDRGPRRDGRGNFREDRRSRWGEEPAGFKDRAGHQHRLSDEGDGDRMDWAAPELDAEALAAADEAADQPQAGPGFADLGVPRPLVRALRAQGITDPFPIQRATIPDAIRGRDVLGRGRTGSGKTLGFGLPLLTRLTGRDHIPNAPGAVVLVPTRELAMQVADVLSPLAREVGLSAQLVAGGMAYAPQVRALERGVDVLVATPGRLIDLMDQGAADLSQVRITVLDEADHMADLGFLPDVQTVLAAVPADGQRLLFSATLDRGVGGLVRDHLHDPVTHEVDRAEASVTTMSHHLVHVAPADKATITAEIANRHGRSVLFVRTQRGADRVAEQLRGAGVMAGALHGGLTQGARSRILAAFKAGTVPVLVATDVAARGIHVDDVGLVLQVDPPADSKDYLHRAGRTARAGEDGVVVTLVLPHQRREVNRLVQRAGVGVEPFAAGPDDETLYRATGARKPAGDPIDEEAYAALIAPPPGRPRRGGRPGGRGRGFGRGRGYGRR